jgi:small basic protein (TIGR04137 family)
MKISASEDLGGAITGCKSERLCYYSRSAGCSRRWNTNTKTRFMSQHSSLRGANTLGAKRNVLKRFERVALLKKRTQWKEGDRVTGLRKTKPEA